jgi:hypothetical protein
MFFVEPGCDLRGDEQYHFNIDKITDNGDDVVLVGSIGDN